jgi:hypothetical protein
MDCIKYTNSEYRIDDNLARRSKSRYMLRVKELENYDLKEHSCLERQNNNEIYIYWIPLEMLK